MKVGNEVLPPISLLRLFSLTLKQYRGAWLVQLGEPCFLLKTLNAPLGLFCDQRPDGLGSSGLHHWDLVHTVSAIVSQQGRASWPFLSPPCQGPDT